MTLAVSKAAEAGAKTVICASTGNTSASAAAYAARAGLLCAVVLPAGHVALGKLAQALIHGARVVPVEANFDVALDVVRELGERPGVEVVNSVNPVRIEGQKTAAFEIVDALGDAPTVHCIPVGNAGNITAYWKGYCEDLDAKRATRAPRMLGWQASGSAPLVIGEPVAHPETIATAIRIGNPASWDGAIEARDASGGHIGAVTDAEILEAYRLLASVEGVFVEPASASSVAGLLRVGQRSRDRERRRGVHAHRARAQGPATRHQRGARRRPGRGERGEGRRGARHLSDVDDNDTTKVGGTTRGTTHRGDHRGIVGHRRSIRPRARGARPRSRGRGAQPGSPHRARRSGQGRAWRVDGGAGGRPRDRRGRCSGRSTAAQRGAPGRAPREQRRVRDDRCVPLVAGRR